MFSLYIPIQLVNKNQAKIIFYLPPLPIRLLANPIHLLGTVSVVRQCLYLNLSKSANSEFSNEWLAWSKRGCKEIKKQTKTHGVNSEMKES